MPKETSIIDEIKRPYWMHSFVLALMLVVAIQVVNPAWFFGDGSLEWVLYTRSQIGIIAGAVILVRNIALNIWANHWE